MYARDRSYSRDRSQNYYKNDYRNDYRKQNHRDLKTSDIRENIKIILNTHMTRMTIESPMETRIGAKIDTKTKTN